jgi:low temperature requirement protein LtrA
MALAAPARGGSDRVSTLELFFDLVFVFTITQIARLTAAAHEPREFAAALLILTIAWWMYGGYAWLTNNIGTEGVTLRLLILLGTAAYFVMALAIPRAGGHDGVAFGVAFFIVTLVHTLLFTRAPNSSARAIIGFAPFNFLAAGFTIAAGFVAPEWRWTCWLAAVAVFLSTSLQRRERGFQLNPTHLAERNGLVIIVAIGESVVSLGSAIEHSDIRGALVLMVLLGFALCAAIWWTYFDGDDERAEHALRQIQGSQRVRTALLGYGYAHLGMIAGIVFIAAGLHDAIDSLGGAVRPATAWLLSAGVTLYLISDKWFRSLLRVGSSHWRGGAALASLAAAPIGWLWSSAGQIAALVLVLVAMLALERVRTPTTSRPSSPSVPRTS